MERGEAFCLSSHGRKRWSGARASASFHTWLEPGQAANAFLGLSGYLSETHERCSAVPSAGGWEKEFQRETYASEGREGTGCGARKRKSDACTESSAPCGRKRCRFNKDSMTFKLSLTASIKTGDFINRESDCSCSANGRNSSSGG